MVDATASPRIEDIARPHQPATTLPGDDRRSRFAGIGTEDVGRCLDIDFESMGHADGKAAEHQGVRVFAKSEVKVMKQYSNLGNGEQ